MERQTPFCRKHIPPRLHLKSRFFGAGKALWRKLGDLESSVLRAELESTPIRQPVYVTGVPRSGTTILTEMLAQHPHIATHRYADFPNVWTPFWRNWLADRAWRKPVQTVERAHRDRIMVSENSPEAVEEVVWMAFFDGLHDPGSRQILDEATEHPTFESFYRDHIRKLLLVRGRSRYASKGNYNVFRLRYLLKLFPDARFIIPYRNPVNQVASLLKQDRLFHRAHSEDQRVAYQLRLSGHFEFGPGRRAVNVGSDAAARIAAYWGEGRWVAGWALYWNSVYEHVLRQLERHDGLRSASLLVCYDDLCRAPAEGIQAVFDHARLHDNDAQAIIGKYSRQISAPDYYHPDFTDRELDELLELTRPAASALGFDEVV
ncbi:sulfotransferase [Wenzhouxiangella sp. EGI_FJ10409]|uniref:sulfotransferase n=1 Tax=Wenzhouxiangella sp. EGI_FJ10409 TaxID=3243767 RepID=UPI0035E210CD